MVTRIEKISVNEIENKKTIVKAAEIIKNGGLVAFPTETVYGLGADAFNAEAAKKIYSAKGRPSDNPLIVHIAKQSDLEKVVIQVKPIARKLMDAFWPGPLTMIFKKSDKVPHSTTGGLDTVAVRMPDNAIALELIKESQTCIAAPSANTSGKPSPTSGQHVIDDLDGKIDMIIDGGDVGIGLESTIIDMTSPVPIILRPGYVTKEMIEELIGKTDIDQTTGLKNDSGLKPKAPGMKYRHYAPNAEMIMLEGNVDDVIQTIKHLSEEKEHKGVKVGIIATEESANLYKYGKVISVGTRKKEETIAKNLYRVLREFNQTSVEVIYCEPFNRDNLGQAIMNRLVKASSNKVITLDEITNIKE